MSHSHTDIANVIRQKKAENGSRDDGRISAWLQAIDMPQYIDVLLGCGWDFVLHNTQKCFIVIDLHSDCFFAHA